MSTVAAIQVCFDCMPGCEVSVFILDCGHVSECDFTAIQVSEE